MPGRDARAAQRDNATCTPRQPPRPGTALQSLSSTREKRAQLLQNVVMALVALSCVAMAFVMFYENGVEFCVSILYIHL